MLDENQEPVTRLNLDSGLTVSFTLDNLSDSLSDSRSSIFGENSARVVSVPVVIVSRSDKFHTRAEQRDKESRRDDRPPMTMNLTFEAGVARLIRPLQVVEDKARPVRKNEPALWCSCRSMAPPINLYNAT